MLTRVAALFMLMVSGVSMANESSIKVQWLGHAAFKITTLENKTILIDPFLTKNPKTPEKLKHFDNYRAIDLILVTHAHADHVGDAIELAQKYQVPLYAPPGLNDTLISLGLLPAKLAPRFNKGGSIYPFNSALKITMSRAEHSSEFKWLNTETDEVEIHVGGEPAGFIIRMENGFTLYHMGDTGIFGDMQWIGEYYKPDLILIPIGGHFVMDPTDAAYAVNHYLKPKYLVPMHYGTFPLLKGTVQELNTALGNSNIKVYDMVPGDIIRF